MSSVFVKLSHILRSLDWWLIAPMMFLIGIGLVMHYSIELNQGGVETTLFTKQLTFVGVGLLFFVVLSFIDIRTFNVIPWIYYGIAVVILVAVLLFGTTIKGTTGWFIVGSVSFQPVELVKILTTLFIASFFSRVATLSLTIRVLMSGFFVSVLLVLVLLQPDLGSAFMLFVLWFGVTLMMRPPKRVLLLIVSVISVVMVVGWFFVLQDYQKDRLAVFVNPSADALHSGYNISQALVAVGSGGLWGRGLGLGTQSQLHFLPEVASDFIFALIAEELGFIGVMSVIFAVMILCGRLWILRSRSNDDFTRIVVGAVLIYIFVQSFFTMGMNVGLLPVTGLPLPLVSAGGSSMVATLFLLGFMHSVARMARR